MENGTRVVTHESLESTEGMGVKEKHVEARRTSAFGRVRGCVPGCGGDVYWVEHEEGVVAAYSFTEFELFKRRRVLPPGTMVRMSARFRAALRANGSREHVAEFGGSVGMVMGPAEWKDGRKGPEIDVRWVPDYLRYMYPPEGLAVSRKKVRGWRKKKELARRKALLK